MLYTALFHFDSIHFICYGRSLLRMIIILNKMILTLVFGIMTRKRRDIGRGKGEMKVSMTAMTWS